MALKKVSQFIFLFDTDAFPDGEVVGPWLYLQSGFSSPLLSGNEESREIPSSRVPASRGATTLC